jgi:cellulose biosynthesis protein BcsQ
MAQDSPIYPNFKDTLVSPQFAANCLGVTQRTLKTIESENDLEIRRVPRGSVSARAYTLSDIFDIAALRRSKGNLKGLANPLTISTFVQKGGTAKTTCCVNMAIYFGFMGLRVLVIDNDPQGDASSMFGYDPDLLPEELEEMGVDPDRAVAGHWGNVLGINKLCPQMPIESVIKKPFGENGPHLIPAEESLDDLDVILQASENQDFRYASFIQRARRGENPACDLSMYDVILIDNAPSGSRLTRNAMVASDLLVSPVRMDRFSFRALTRLADRLTQFKDVYGRAPDIAAIPTMFIKNRPRIMSNLAKLSELFPGKVTEGKLFFSEDYSKALEEGLPVLAWKGASENSAGAMREVFADIASRLRTLAG